MANERSQVPQKANHEPAAAEKSAAQEKTPAPASSYLPAPGQSLSGAASPDDIPLTRDNILYLQRTIGNRAVVQLLQRKTKLSQPGDEYEREADRVADQVLRMPNQANEDEKRKRPEEETTVQAIEVSGSASGSRIAQRQAAPSPTTPAGDPNAASAQTLIVEDSAGVSQPGQMTKSQF